MKTSIKRVRTRRDWRALRRAELLCFPEDDRPDFHVGRWFLLLVGAELAGFCSAELSREDVFLARAGVLPEWRGYGLQKIMIDYRVGLAKGKPVVTYTAPDNAASMNSLIACGFRISSIADDGFINWERL